MSSLAFHKLSWGQLEKDCLLLYPKIKDLQIDRLVSISQGGNVVSRIVSDLLGSLPISHITITSYEHTKKLRTPIITEEPTVSFKDMTTLIVDEVSDTGDTFDIATNYFKKKASKKYTHLHRTLNHTRILSLTSGQKASTRGSCSPTTSAKLQTGL